MGSPKITMFLISLIVVSFMASSIFVFVSNMTTPFGSANYENVSGIEDYDKMEELYEQTRGIQENETNVKTKSFVENIFDNLFGDAYNIIGSTRASIGIFEEMVENSLETNLGIVGANFKMMLVLIVIILVVLGVIIAVIVRAKTGGI